MKYIIAMLSCLFVIQLNAQTSQTEFSAKKINFMEVNEIKVIQYNGSQVIFENGGDGCRGLGDHGDDEQDERSRGLSSINAMGLKDNTGIGLSIKQDGTELNIYQISSNNDNCYLVKVPSGTGVYYEHSTHQGEDVRFEGLDGEVEVTAKFNDIFFKDITGVLSINTIHGAIEGNFETVNQGSPISIHSVHDIVDITIPSATKANFKLVSKFGEIFTNLDLDVVALENGMKKHGGDEVSGKYNGGGVDFMIKASHDNIYLRKN